MPFQCVRLLQDKTITFFWVGSITRCLNVVSIQRRSNAASFHSLDLKNIDIPLFDNTTVHHNAALQGQMDGSNTTG